MRTDIMNDIGDDRMSYDELREFEPFDWPGRYLVEQDNMGDWGFWLSQFDGWLQGVLQEPTEDVAPLAEAIALEYIADCRDTGFPLPADFAECGDIHAARAADQTAITEEFDAYLRKWQVTVAARMEHGT